MSQSIVSDSSCEDTKYLIDITEEPLDSPSVTDIDSIKLDGSCATIKDEIDIKEEPLDTIDESDLSLETRSTDPLSPNSSNSKVCGLKYLLDILLFYLLFLIDLYLYKLSMIEFDICTSYQ